MFIVTEYAALIDAKTHSFYPLVQHESNLISILMIIEEKIRKLKKIAEKIKGYTYKIMNISAANCHREANMLKQLQS